MHYNASWFTDNHRVLTLRKNSVYHERQKHKIRENISKKEVLKISSDEKPLTWRLIFTSSKFITLPLATLIDDFNGITVLVTISSNTKRK